MYMYLPEPTICSVSSIYLGAKFAYSVLDNLDQLPDWAKDESTFDNYFIIVFFVICYLGSLPTKIAALRYFTFITAIINLYLGVVVFSDAALNSPISRSEQAIRIIRGIIPELHHR